MISSIVQTLKGTDHQNFSPNSSCLKTCIYLDIFLCLEVFLSGVRDVYLTKNTKYGSLLLSSSQLQATENKNTTDKQIQLMYRKVTVGLN